MLRLRRPAAGLDALRLDGPQILRLLRADGHATPALLLAARGELPDRVGGLDAGADDYLAKPFELDERFARAGPQRLGALQAAPTPTRRLLAAAGLGIAALTLTCATDATLVFARLTRAVLGL